MEQLAQIEEGGVEEWVNSQLVGLFSGDARRSGAFRGGQTAADEALGELDIDGYARRRSAVHPPDRRGASKLSPYIRHGLLDLRRVHDHPAVADANSYDRFKYRGELLWQDYSRQWYAVFGRRTRQGIVHEPRPGRDAANWDRAPWPSEMNCVKRTLDELRSDGWMVNQTRMWMASQWAVRAGSDWTEGEDAMFRHLLDGSRAANRQGWQWVVGGVRNRSYGFAKRQVMKRAPDYCSECELQDTCPIGGYPGSVTGEMVEPVPTMRTSMLRAAGTQPSLFEAPVVDADDVDGVWITAESLGDADPALAAHPEATVHFVFDEPLLRHLRLDGKRLVFLADCLADLSKRRDLKLWRGRPVDLIGGTDNRFAEVQWAATAAPVPGFAKILDRSPARLRLQSWPWLRPPTAELMERLNARRFPSFKDWCRLTKPSTR